MSPLDLLVAAPLVMMILSLLAPSLQRWLLWLAIAVMAWLASWMLALPEGTGHVVGGWELPLGILLRADGMARLLVPAAAIAASFIGLYALRDFAPEKRHRDPHAAAFWPLFYLMWSAFNAALLTTDLFNLYITLEMATLAAVALAAMGSLAAALRYFLVAILGSIFYLLGVALTYSRYATIDATVLATVATPDFATIVAIALMTGGLLAKVALFPVHGWLRPAHAAAPAPASALLSGLAVKIGFVIIVRIWFEAMAAATTSAGFHLLGGFGALAILFGSFQAIRQRELKPLVAYSTVAQVGYLFLAFPLIDGAVNPDRAWAGMSIHAAAHLISKASMFLAAGLMVKAAKNTAISALSGVARTMPLTLVAFGLSAVSLMGLPPSGGFTAKFLLVESALRQGAFFYAAVMLVGGLLAAVYLFRPLTAAMATGNAPAAPRDAGWPAATALGLALTAIAMGFAGTALVDCAGDAPTPLVTESAPK